MDYSKIPSAFRDIFQSIDREVIWIHSKWLIYQQLFSGSEDNTDLFNKSAGFFFGVVQRTFFEDSLLGISRLTDPPKSMGKDNRSLAQLIDKLLILGYNDLVKDLESDLKILNSISKPFREWRNKKIAHSDLGSNLLVNSDPLPGITTKNIEEALAVIRQFMNRVNGYFTDSETIYDHFVTARGGKALLSKLKIADDAEKKNRKEFLDLNS
ncbi:MAG: hypothetical protein MUO76_02290 [Anaerolineaceae bacterium]|nr:hypothetical protein [Anaerolineaceae bacterium]